MTDMPFPIKSPDLILFGGAFDPPHLGHKDCVELTTKAFSLAEIFIVPSLLSPVSSSQVKSHQASFDDRALMCELAFKNLGKNPRVLDIERHLPSPSYTIQTLRELEKSYPGKRLGLLLGLDQFEKFLTWKEPVEILKRCCIVLVKRGNANLDEVLKQFSRDLNLEVKTITKTLVSIASISSIHILNGQTMDISSTKLREQLLTNPETPIKGLSPAVHEFIRAKSLYC